MRIRVARSVTAIAAGICLVISALALGQTIEKKAKREERFVEPSTPVTPPASNSAQSTPRAAAFKPPLELSKEAEQRFASRIRDLDATEFLTRETAMLQLLEAGPAVLPALRPVLTGGSLEATSRALFIVRQVGLAADLDG